VVRRIGVGSRHEECEAGAEGPPHHAPARQFPVRRHRINPQAYLEAAFSETITTDNAAEWLPKVWHDRVTALSESARPTPVAVDTPAQAGAT
jgi:hypothetical protein